MRPGRGASCVPDPLPGAKVCPIVGPPARPAGELRNKSGPARRGIAQNRHRRRGATGTAERLGTARPTGPESA